jgi:hypothetical protein
VLCVGHCFIWLRDLDTKKTGEEIFGELQNVGLEKIKWPEKVTNEQVLERIGEKKTLLNNFLLLSIEPWVAAKKTFS